MSSRLSQRLNAARRSNFIGRSSEQELFRAAIEQEFPKFNILYLYGPGGVGKTTLMKQFNDMAIELGARAVYLDGRNLEPSPSAFLTMMAKVLDLGSAAFRSPRPASRHDGDPAGHLRNDHLVG
jgi:chromosomal replication initiation ATPase DnaA